MEHMNCVAYVFGIHASHFGSRHRPMGCLGHTPSPVDLVGQQWGGRIVSLVRARTSPSLRLLESGARSEREGLALGQFPLSGLV